MHENWFMLGDIHGWAMPIRYFYEENKEKIQFDKFDNYLILLGDVCCNYDLGKGDKHFKEELSKYPFNYICLRGNHERRVEDVIKNNKDNWIIRNQFGGKVFIEKKYPKIIYLEDTISVYSFAGYKTLSIPGAYSVDRSIRIQWEGEHWFHNEQLSDIEREQGFELIRKEKEFDLVISHTCPIRFEPRDLFLPQIDQSKVDKTMELFLGEIEHGLDYKRWAFGHYHDNRLFKWDNGKQAVMLNNEYAIDLEKFMKMSEKDYFKDILI